MNRVIRYVICGLLIVAILCSNLPAFAFADSADDTGTENAQQANSEVTEDTENSEENIIQAESQAVSADERAYQGVPKIGGADTAVSDSDEEKLRLLSGTEEEYPTNIVNGSFEETAYYLDTSNSMVYKSADAGTITGWRTTATDNKIEVAWLSNRQSTGGTSKHMTTISNTINTLGGADGSQFIETVGKTHGSPYQQFAVSAGETLSWQFSHRGRMADDDTVAMFIGPSPASLSALDKSSAEDNDIFYQLVSWLKVTKEVTAPANNAAVTYTVYTTEVDPATHQLSTAEVEDPFSDSADAAHTQRWQVTLFSSNNEKWNTVRGSYTADTGQTGAIIAFAPFWSSFDNGRDVHPGLNTGGNLLDAISVKNSAGVELIVGGSFDDIRVTGKYLNANAANASSPTAGIGQWRTTSSDRIIEVGVYTSAYNAYTLKPSYGYTLEPYIRDGCQFAELNATQESTLYQYISTKPGTKYSWSLSHRGRTGIDTMALIIGPKQTYDPKKLSSDSRDQLMQIVDWLKQQTDVPIAADAEDQCTQKLYLYTGTFDDSGGFSTADPFSWTRDAEHTELWNIWVISSTNDKWYDYGATDPDADYDYSYYVPAGVDTSIFAFVSLSSSPRTDTGVTDLSYGNLLDNTRFDLYYSVIGNSTPNGSGAYMGADSPEEIASATEIPFSAENEYSGWALSETAFRIVAKEDHRTFLGATVNGVFVPVTEWTANPETGEYYYDCPSVTQNYRIRLIFAAEKVVYDVNGGNPYHWNPEDPETGYEVTMDAIVRPEYTSHAAQSDKDGWRFDGWLYTTADSEQIVFAGVHTINFLSGASSEADDTMQITGPLFGGGASRTVSNISASAGVTMVAQWLYRQRFATQLYDRGTQTYLFSTAGGTITANLDDETTAHESFTADSITVGTDYYIRDNEQMVTVTAEENPGYRFLGWVDAQGKTVSSTKTYSYRAHDRIVNTLFARFEEVRASLTVRKVIPEEYGQSTQYFALQVTFSGLNLGESYPVSNDTEGNIRLSDGTVVSNPGSIQADADGQAQTTIYLQSGQESVFTELPPACQYTVVEEDYSSRGYISQGNVSEPVTLGGDSTVTITNILTARKLTIKKLGCEGPNQTESAEPLTGAGFTLYSDAACTAAIGQQQVTDSNGETTFEGLLPNTDYYLKETRTPSGYGVNGKTYRLSVRDDGIYQITEGAETKLNEGIDNSSLLTVYNYAQLTLPSSGSPALLLLFVTGIILMMFMCIWVISLNVKMKQRRTK